MPLVPEYHRVWLGGDHRKEVTQLFHAWRQGDAGALDKLMPLVFTELQRLTHICMARERPGRTLLHYRLEGEINLCGMGVVCKARDTHLNRRVAIKVLPPDKMADPEGRHHFI